MRGGSLLFQLSSEALNAVRAQLEFARNGALLSAALHVTVILLIVFGLPQFVDPPSDSVVPVELVLLEEDEPEPKPEPEPEPKVTAEEVAPEPEPPKQEAKAVPEPVAPEPEPEPEAVPPPESKPEPEKVVKPLPPKPKRRPDVKVAMPDKHKKKDKPKPDQLTSILRNVERLREQPRQRHENTAKAQTQGRTSRSASVFEQREMVRAIQDQLRRCWRIDPGARGAFRSAAENAKRAINRCSPFRLPPRKYDVWRQLTLRFDPREMFGT
jgi:outer membrane biosynthesis protein TonB